MVDDFTIGGVIRRTLALVGRHLGAFATAAAILVVLPNLVLGAADLNGTTVLGPNGAARDASAQVSFLGSGAGLLVLLPQILLYGIIIRTALGDLRGERGDMAPAIAASLRLFLPNLLISLLFFLGLLLGYTLLVVPGIMLQCAWTVVIPAYMAERPGVFGAFGRSRALTAGHRWRIFGLLLIYGLVMMVLFGIGFALVIPAARNGIGTGGLWLFKALMALFTALTNVVGGAGAAVVYIELRRAKEGFLSAEVVDAFS